MKKPEAIEKDANKSEEFKLTRAEFISVFLVLLCY